MKQYYIYLTTHTTNGKQYIGQHYGELDDNYYGSGTIMLKILAKEGTKNLKKEILCICNSREEADEKEREYIEKYNAVEDPHFYNLQEGGTKGDGWRAAKRWKEQHPEEAERLNKEGGERLQKWRKDNPEKFQEQVVKPMLEASVKWREEHSEEVAAIMVKVNQAKEEWQRVHPEEHQAQVDRWREMGSEANSKKVRCITTGEEFPSFSAAERAYKQYGVAQANLTKVFKGERKSCGKKDGKKLLWELIN